MMNSPDIRPAPEPSVDPAIWQQSRLQGNSLETQLSYWKQQLDGAPAVLELPTDQARSAIQIFQGACQYLSLPKPLTEALHSLSQQEGVTPFMTLLAAFKILLSRYTNHDDIVVGTPAGDRGGLEIKESIAYFSNPLVLRTPLSGDPTFRELLSRVREVALGAYAHQEVPLKRLLEELQPEPDLSHHPLFQVMFVLHDPSLSAPKPPGFVLRPLKADSGPTQLDLTLSIVEAHEGLTGSLEYNTNLFQPATITRMLGHYQTLLEGIAANPDECIGTLPLVTEGERHQLLGKWNNTAGEYPIDQCLHQLFEAQVERTPEAVALVFENEQMTYAELNRRANQLAHHLRSLGVGTEVLVGICVERSLEMVVGLLGILHAGGAYVPFDPEYPKERFAFMLQDAQVSVLFSGDERQLKIVGVHHARSYAVGHGSGRSERLTWA